MRSTRSILAMTLLLACCTACGRAPSTGAPKPFNRYIASMLPLFAGAYHGSCKRASEAPRQDAVTISGTGVASTGIWKHDLMREKGILSMERNLDAGKPFISVVTFQGKAPDWNFILSSFAEPALPLRESVSVSEGKDVISCDGLAPASGLGERVLYPAVASHFSAASGPMSCEAVSKDKPEKTSVRIGARGVEVDEFSVAFDREVKSERLIADQAADTLTYAVNHNNGDEFVMVINGDGALVSASFLGMSGLWVCKQE